MNTLLSLSLVASAMLIILGVTYLLFIRRRQGWRANRFTVLAIIVLTGLAPLALLLPSGNPSIPTATDHNIPHESAGLPVIILDVKEADAGMPVASWIPEAASAARTLYAAGVAVVAALLLISAVRLLNFIRGAKRVGERIHVTKHDVAPFAWGGIIVMSEHDWNSDKRHIIIAHERAHTGSGHWLDLLAANVLRVFTWYNPAAWMLGRELHRLHEYEADTAVIASGTDKYEYQRFLIEKAAGRRLASLADSLHQSNLKKRITMMSKKSSRHLCLKKMMLLAPAALLAVAAVRTPAFAAVVKFSNTEKPAAAATATVEISHKVTETTPSVQAPIKMTGTTEDVKVVSTKAIKVINDTQRIAVLDSVVASTKADTAASGKSQPVYVVNGVITNNNFADSTTRKRPVILGVNDIESVTVLKEDAATALYGPLGKNGIILISARKDIDLENTFGKAPLYVVDGEIYDGIGIENDGHETDSSGKRLINLEPGEIKSVTVLHHDKAIELYGQEGANGVVIITTNRHKVTYDGVMVVDDKEYKVELKLED